MTQQAPYQPQAHDNLTDLLRTYEIILNCDYIPAHIAVETADLRALVAAAHPYRLTVAREQTYDHASRITETYINSEYEAQGRAAQMIFDELRLLAEPKPSASFGIYLAKIIDEMSVDNFTLRMKEKLAKKRTEGRRGWMDMSADDLSVMLRQHVDKGDPVDVANLCMFLSANNQNIAPDTKTVNGTMTPEEIRIENLKQMAKYDGQIISFACCEPYYLASCDHCGWVGSSEVCGSDSFGDDSDVYCPRCHSSGADCGKVAERLSTKSVDVAALLNSAALIIEGRSTAINSDFIQKLSKRNPTEIASLISYSDMELGAAIRALSPAEPAQAEQWRPIATAPKDGTEFIARCGANKPFFSCFWDGSAFMHYEHGEGLISYSPIEWMPLPATPTPEAGQ